MRLLVAVLFVVGIAAALEYPWTEWEKVEKSPASQTLSFTLALKLENLDVLDDLTVRLTTPGSPEFRQWKTMEELNKITQPDVRGVRRLLRWLKTHNLAGEDFSDFIKVTGTVADIEAAFNAEIYAYKNLLRKASPVVIHRSSVHPEIPSQFEGLVVFITGLSNFPYPSRPHFSRVADSVDNYYVVPQTLRNQYSVPSSYVASSPKSSQGLVEFGTQAGVSIPDLQQFMQLTGGNTSATLAYTVGNFKFNPIDPVDTESTLDVQYIMAMAPGVPTSFFVVDGWIYDFASLIQQRSTQGLPVPNIFSVSYGWAEGDQCEITGQGTGCGQLGGTSASYVSNTNAGLQKVGLLGVSIFVASGDAGAATKENIHCLRRHKPIQPDYPASSNYVTTVGGTMFSTAQTLSAPLPPFCSQSLVTCAGSGVEVVSQLPDSEITSGGGFSNVAATPSWQAAQVQSYLSSGALIPPVTEFNRSGRAYPDITALAHHFMIVERGESLAVDGTSASAPLTAGIFALINDNILKSGGNPLGFLNPALYQAFASGATLSQDIIYGNNTTTEKSGLGLKPPCTTAGYGATKGWDAVSGVGSPNYPGLLSALS